MIESDGRRQRGQDNRARIVKAMLELVEAGDVAPVAEDVAAKADVGLRTVFRHFKDMDSLYGEMSAVVTAEVRALVERPFTATSWRGELSELVDRRAVLFERIAPFRRASERLRYRSAFIAEEQVRLVTTLRDILRQVIPMDMGAVNFEALDLFLSYEAWSRLRRDQNLSVDDAKEVIRRSILGITG